MRRLLERGDEVTILYRREGKRERLPEEIRREVRFLKGDVLEPDSLTGCTRGMEWVFHAAGTVAWGRALRKSMGESHVQGTKNMVVEVIRGDVNRLIQTSSAAAVGFSETGEPVDETFPFNGDQLNNGYAMAKWQAERIVLKETEAGGCREWWSIRASFWGRVARDLSGKWPRGNCSSHRQGVSTSAMWWMW